MSVRSQVNCITAFQRRDACVICISPRRREFKLPCNRNTKNKLSSLHILHTAIAYLSLSISRRRYSAPSWENKMRRQREEIEDEIKEDEIKQVKKSRGSTENEVMYIVSEDSHDEKSPKITRMYAESDDEELSEGELISSLISQKHKEYVREDRRVKGGWRKSEKFLTVYQKPPPSFPKDLSELQRREAVHFQRKMRAFRNMKNHLLTAKIEDLKIEAEQKNWGELPNFLTENRPKFSQVHIEVMYHYWPEPFEDVERLWLTRHFKEFKRQWDVPDEEVIESEELTPYMRYIRCYPHQVLYELRRVIPPSNRPSKRALGLPITGENLITDAKAILTYYGMHRLKDWEVHDNIDYQMMDYQILLEEFLEASKLMIRRMKSYKNMIKKSKQQDEESENSI